MPEPDEDGAAVLTDEPSHVTRPIWCRERWATWVFAAAAVVALPFILYQGRQRWFFIDDYDFFSDRRLSSFADLMRSHNGHWSTLPIIEYRVLYQFFGMQHFWPYQVVVVLAHLATATLLYVVMRRARVNPWIATAAGILFIYFGAGADDIEVAFQIGFTGALACGLAFLLLTDHDGPVGRRDVVGMAFGLAALMFSAVGVAAVAAVGAAVALRRGWRPALVLVGPLAAIFLVWYVSYGRQTATPPAPSFTGARVFVWAWVSNLFGQLTQISPFGWVLAAVLVAGTVVAVRSSTFAEIRRRDAAIAGLFLGGLVFLAVTLWNRGFFVSPGDDRAARVSRYLYVAAAFALPALAAAGSYLAGRRPVAVVAVVALLLVGLPRNFDRIYPQDGARYTMGRPGLLVAVAHSRLLARAPAAMQPAPILLPDLTPRWLRNAIAAGKIPLDGEMNDSDRATAALALSLEQLRGPGSRQSCRDVAARDVNDLQPGEEVVIPKGITVVTSYDRAVTGSNEYQGPGVLRALHPLRVRFGRSDRGGTSQVCPG